mgnify:CR=1 FL=1|tara:strand:- start:10490 stop:12568 length:2079 start_codon:yes stop_codon:yes gene_type:complete
MGLLDFLFKGQNFGEVLGGVAMQYNKISDEQRAAEFEEKQLDKKIQAEKDTQLEIAREKLKVNKFNPKEFRQKERIKAEEKAKVAKPDPNLFTLDLTKTEGLLDDSLKEKFVVKVPEFVKGDTIGNADRRLIEYSKVFPRDVLEKLRKEPLFNRNKGGDTKLVASLDGLQSNIIGLYKELSGKQPVITKDLGVSKGEMTLLPKNVLERMFINHPFLQNKYLSDAGISAKEFNKQRGITVSSPKMTGDKGVVIDIYDDTANNYSYYEDKTEKGIMKTDIAINNLNAGAFKNLNLAQKKYYFDELAQGVGEKDGGFLIKTALSLKPKVANYTEALQRPLPETAFAIKKFFNDHPDRDKFKKNLQLALYAIRIALPETIDDGAIFKDQKFRGIFQGRAFEDTTEGKLILEEEKRSSRNRDLKQVGFPKPEQVEFKKQSNNRIIEITNALKDVIQKGGGIDPKTGLHTPALVGLAKDVFINFEGAMSQAQQFGEIFTGLFKDEKSIKAVEGARDRAIAAYDKIQKAQADGQPIRAALLIDYYAEILTFTMAGTIQSGSQGTVDTRTISDSDVRRIGNALRQKLALAIRGDTTVLDEILLDYGRKKFVLDNITSPNRRNQSAAVLYNRVLEDVSLFDARSLEQNYDVEPDLKEIDILDVDKTKPENQQNLSDKMDEELNPFVNRDKQQSSNKLTFAN